VRCGIESDVKIAAHREMSKNEYFVQLAVNVSSIQNLLKNIKYFPTLDFLKAGYIYSKKERTKLVLFRSYQTILVFYYFMARLIQ